MTRNRWLVLGGLSLLILLSCGLTLMVINTRLAAEPTSIVEVDQNAVATQVAIMQEERTNESRGGYTSTPTSPALEATQTPHIMVVTATPQPNATAVSQVSTPVAVIAPQGASFDQVEDIGLIKVSGFPEESYPVRWGNGVVQDVFCPVDDAGWILCDPGVISFDFANGEIENNPSAVWSGGANVDNLLENETGTYTCPEGGYTKVTYPQAIIQMPQIDLGIEVVAAPETNYTLIARCLYSDDSEGSSDRNVVMDFTTEHPGRVKIMRYPVNPDAGGFYSFVHVDEDLTHGHGGTSRGADNCGSSGCEDSYVILIDMNHKTLTIFYHTIIGGWHLVYTNAVQP